MSKRGFLYLAWGTAHEKMLERSLASVRKHHPELPIHVERLPETSTMLDKIRMVDVSPFETTAYLDTDTVVLGRLDFAFEQAERVGLACCICECPWARRAGGLMRKGDIVEYNAGVIFFTKKATPVFDAWKKHAGMDSSIEFFEMGSNELKVMPLNDQGPLALAIDETGFVPFVLPMNWNFRPIWQKGFFGPLKIWHDYSDPPAGLEEHCRQQSVPEAVISFARIS